MRAEIVIIVALVLITAATFGIEALGPDGARIVGIAVCLLLLALMVMGLVARAARRRQAADGGVLETQNPTGEEPGAAAAREQEQGEGLGRP